ncbi:MAG: hypothetical protein DMG31_13575 [Acidobacteria bacterium]|nr:MAG: hypothetical protein DMG31_13575 [Acidobacteriota bacterium]
MTDIGSEINAALVGDGPIPRERVLVWIEAAADLSTIAKLYRLTDEGYYRIRPELGREVTCGLIQRYFLQCIRQGVDDDEIQGRYEAARSLHLWFCHLSEVADTTTILAAAARAVTELFLTAGEDVRGAIETGFLEHVLETAALRPYFDHWSSDTRLKEAWERAMEWGKAHPDYTWGLLKQLRKLESK